MVKIAKPRHAGALLRRMCEKEILLKLYWALIVENFVE